MPEYQNVLETVQRMSANDRQSMLMMLSQALQQTGTDMPIGGEQSGNLEILQYMTRQPVPLRNLRLLGVHSTECVRIKKESGKIVEIPASQYDPEEHELVQEPKKVKGKAALPPGTLMSKDSGESDDDDEDEDEDDEDEDEEDEKPPTARVEKKTTLKVRGKPPKNQKKK
jgi:hypothetical protein